MDFPQSDCMKLQVVCQRTLCCRQIAGFVQTLKAFDLPRQKRPSCLCALQRVVNGYGSENNSFWCPKNLSAECDSKHNGNKRQWDASETLVSLRKSFGIFWNMAKFSTVGRAITIYKFLPHFVAFVHSDSEILLESLLGSALSSAGSNDQKQRRGTQAAGCPSLDARGAQVWQPLQSAALRQQTLAV